jgi:hypothetical protein
VTFPTAAQFAGITLPATEKTSPEEFKAVLAHLEYLLANLPEQLPSSDSFFSQYGVFLSFALDPDILEKTGDDIATLGEQLEGVWLESTDIWRWHQSHSGTWQGHLCTVPHFKGVS